MKKTTKNIFSIIRMVVTFLLLQSIGDSWDQGLQTFLAIIAVLTWGCLCYIEGLCD